MQPLRWLKHGRLYGHTDEGAPNKRTYRTSIGQVNVDVGDGTFAPYVVDAGAIRHGDSSCTFDADGQSFRRLGQVLISRSRIFIQRQAGQNWNNVPHGTPTRNVLTDYPTEGKCTAYLDFPDIQGYAQGARFQVGMTVGGNDRQRYGFRMRSPQAGTFRLEWIIEVPADADLAWIEQPSERHNPTSTPVRLGGRIGPIEITWHPGEAPFRTVTVENLGAAGRVIHVFFGPYTLAANEWLDIAPDMSDLRPAANGDDWYIEYNGTSWDWYSHYSWRLYQGAYNSRRCWGGYRFALSEAIPDNATIDSAQIELYPSDDAYDAFGAGDSLTIWATQSADAPATTDNAAGGRPNIGTGAGSLAVCTAVVRWPASGDYNWINNNWNISPDIKSIIQELVDDYNGLADGAHVVLWVAHTSEPAGDNEVGVEALEYTGTNQAKLDIAWTEGGGTTYYGTPADSASLSEAIARQAAKRAAESLGLTEDQTLQVSRSIAEALSLNEGLVRQSAKRIAESVGLAEQLTTSIMRMQAVSDTLAPSETLDVQIGTGVADAVSLVESASRRAGKTLGETLALTEAAIREARKALAESVGLTEALDAQLIGPGEYTQNVTDTASLAESISRVTGRTVAESVALVEDVTLQSAKGIADSLGLSEALLVNVVKLRATADSLSLTEALGRVVVKAVQESLGITEDLGADVQRVLAESLGLTEAVRRALTRTVAETLGLTEQLQAQIVGLLGEVLVATVRSLTPVRTVASLVPVRRVVSLLPRRTIEVL